MDYQVSEKVQQRFDKAVDWERVKKAPPDKAKHWVDC